MSIAKFIHSCNKRETEIETKGRRNTILTRQRATKRSGGIIDPSFHLF
jgi:hypothetical protein